MAALILPSGYSRVKVVHSFQELVTTPFANGINALCWQRELVGDFDEIVERLAVTEGILTLDEELLRSLPLSSAGKAAMEILLADQQLLADHGLEPTLDCIHAYPREEQPGAVPIDVYSFHADSAPVEADTYLCSYNATSSEALRNQDARLYVDIPEVRAELLRISGLEDNAEFLEYLNENCFDLHYAPKEGAKPFSFGIGNMWRIAVEYPESPVPPCIHRAPEQDPNGPSRLLLIS